MPDDSSNWSMATHNLALTAMNTIEFHMNECEKRDARLVDRYDKIEMILTKQDTRMDEMWHAIVKMQLRAAFALGAFMSIWELVKLAIEWHK